MPLMEDGSSQQDITNTVGLTGYSHLLSLKRLPRVHMIDNPRTHSFCLLLGMTGAILRA
ncbi:hypothetical protein DPMN_099638 [Dreissena polymorpha]|uniref:Uncharacterized protein n=1 Tax=Dreissena polymorpha TaxID=45954 RepID=A0A9D4R6M4_DREPO|nr:hypothetical protein DPMN_099638 [Dreissena polymorpha]